MSDDRSTVKTFRNDIGFRERLVGISVRLCRSFLIIGMASTLYFVIRGTADARQHGLRSAFALHIIQEVIVYFETYAVFLKILNQLGVGHLVADSIVNVVLAHRPGSFACAEGWLGITDQVWQLLIGNFDQTNRVLRR